MSFESRPESVTRRQPCCCGHTYATTNPKEVIRINHNFIFTDVNEALPRLLTSLLHAGDEVGSRDGRTMELTHVGITLEQPWKRELLLPERKASIAAQVAETMWVLAGRSDVGWLSNYLPRAAQFSDDGQVWRAGYGPRLRSWWNLPPGTRVAVDQPVDQLAYVYNTLKASPSSRQAVASIWDPVVDTQPGKDIPCNDWLSFSSRLGKLDLHVAVRSNDAMWGWSGINTFEWSALLEVMAGLLGLGVGKLHFSVTSFHLYERHWAKASRIKHAVVVDPLYLDPSPKFGDVDDLATLDLIIKEWFRVEDNIRNDVGPWREDVDFFPEPMLQSWLRVIAWWWTGDLEHLLPVKNTRLWEAARMSVQPPSRVAL